MHRMKLLFLLLAGVLFYGLETQQAEAGCTHLGTVGACPVGVSNGATSQQVLTDSIRWNTGQVSFGIQCCPADAGLNNPVNSFRTVFGGPAFGTGPQAVRFGEDGPLGVPLFENLFRTGPAPTFRFQAGGPSPLDESLFDPGDRSAAPTFRFDRSETEPGQGGENSDAQPSQNVDLDSTDTDPNEYEKLEIARQARREFTNIMQETVARITDDPLFEGQIRNLAGLLVSIDVDDEVHGTSRSEAVQTDEYIRNRSGSSYGVPGDAQSGPPAGESQGPNGGNPLGPIIDTQIQQNDRTDGSERIDSVMDDIESFFVKT